MTFVKNFKDVVLGLFLLLILASIVTFVLQDANISGMAKVIVGFVLTLAALGLAFAAFKMVK